ncbi:helix-turn-helix domain-containing protein [uncultured Amnibacterium sp.]|uniref:AraC family transcriptional regulator n=1 Tax=uncultured Amnibacterium sp. TaxID=1631851 RepID=UPI0035CA2218
MRVIREASQDIEVILDSMGTMFPGIRMSGPATRETSFTMDGFTGGEDLVHLDYRFEGREARAEVDRDGSFVFCDLLEYDGGIDDGRTEIDKNRPLVLPKHVLAHWEHGGSRALSIRESAVHRVLEAHHMPNPGKFDILGTAPVGAAGDIRWSVTKNYVQQAMRIGLADVPVIAATLTELLIETMLLTFPTNASGSTGERRLPSTAAVRRATAYADEHAGRPITVADMAAAARLSVRGLQDAFQRQLGLTPTAYLRATRLAATRDALLAADGADGTQVSTIARAAGFMHLSRFAAAYRAAYGEHPSQTLRR